ncbi:hypothetical protein, partial [Cylindrospermopsis raciborskii]|uniref:hypothetical protein n=1 Tax=Cylindrospermopsis raciborskii TaxID=77022 RepID=UPI001CA5E850
ARVATSKPISRSDTYNWEAAQTHSARGELRWHLSTERNPTARVGNSGHLRLALAHVRQSPTKGNRATMDARIWIGKCGGT